MPRRTKDRPMTRTATTPSALTRLSATPDAARKAQRRTSSDPAALTAAPWRTATTCGTVPPNVAALLTFTHGKPGDDDYIAPGDLVRAVVESHGGSIGAAAYALGYQSRQNGAARLTGIPLA